MLTKLSVQNFRSFKDVELPLGRLNVLIGPNGSGKSNVLDVLRLITELVSLEDSLNNVFSRRGGYDQVVWGGETDREVAIELAWDAPPMSERRYAMQFGQRGGSVFYAGERLSEPSGDELRRRSPSLWEYGRVTAMQSGSAPAERSALRAVGKQGPLETINVIEQRL